MSNGVAVSSGAPDPGFHYARERLKFR